MLSARSGLNRRCRLLAAAAVLCLFTGGAKAQSLTEALAATYENNPTLLAARAELRAVNEGVAQANSAWKPDVTLDGSIGYQQLKNEPVPGEFQDTFPKQVAITVDQSIYEGGSIDANIESAEAVVRAQRALLADTEQTVLLAAVTAYMDVWRDQAVLDLNRQNEERLARQRQAALERFNVGEITRTDVAQADSRLAGATAARIASEATLARSIAVFRQVIGLDPTAIQQPPSAPGLPENLEIAVAEAHQQQPELMAARELESSALANVRSRLGDLLPDVSLVAVLSYRELNQFSDTSSTSAQILAQVSIPLYQQGFTFSQVREAKQRANERRLLVVEAERSAELTSVSAWQGLVSAQAQIDSFSAQVDATNIALDGVTQENTVGARTVLDILDAEQEVLDAQTSLVRAQRDEVVASYTLLASVGRLTAANLNLPVAVYDPEVDYEAVRNAWFGLEAPGTP